MYRACDRPSRIDAALVAKQIDVASFEDEPALDAQRKLHGYALTSVATTVTFPVALYSRKLTNLGQLQRGATIAIPDDPAGTARALNLLQNETLLTFRDSAGLHATLADITSNRLHLKIRRVPRASVRHVEQRRVRGVRQRHSGALRSSSRSRWSQSRRRALAACERADRARQRSPQRMGRATGRRLSFERRRAFHPHALSGLGASAVVKHVFAFLLRVRSMLQQSPVDDAGGFVSPSQPVLTRRRLDDRPVTQQLRRLCQCVSTRKGAPRRCGCR